jgi:hypothetical protein
MATTTGAANQDFDMAANGVCICEIAPGKRTIHDDCRTGIAAVGGIELASLKKGNLQSLEVTRAHDEVAAARLLVAFRDRLTVDLEVLFVGKIKREIAGDRGRRKDKPGDEPQGCPSSGAIGAREPRSYEGTRPLCRLGIACGDLLAGSALRRPHASQESRIHIRCCTHACSRDRCHYSSIQYGRGRAAKTPAVLRGEPTFRNALTMRAFISVLKSNGILFWAVHAGYALSTYVR